MIDNPYITKLHEEFPGVLWNGDLMQDELRIYRDGELVSHMDSKCLDMINSIYGSARDRYRGEYAFAIPNEEAAKAMKRFAPYVEIGAGTGYWAWYLAQFGIEVATFDNRSWAIGRNGKIQYGKWQRMIKGSHRMAYNRYAGRSLFLCWPPYDSCMANNALCAAEKSDARAVAYVGENDGGCTGDCSFHERLDKNWELEDAVEIPRWPGLHDRLYVMQNKRFV